MPPSTAKFPTKFPAKLPALVRVAGRDRQAGALLQEAQDTGRFATAMRLNSQVSTTDDYAQIDLTLDIAEPTLTNPVTMPKARVGYGGLTPQQRHRMLTWLDDPLGPAPETIRQIYIAQLETNLFEPGARAREAIQELRRLLRGDTWTLDLSASRAILLGYWLHQDGEGLADYLHKHQLPTPLLGIALGHLALLNKPLTVRLVRTLIQQWLPQDFGSSRPMPSEDILALRLTSWTATLGEDPLAFALAQLSDGSAPTDQPPADQPPADQPLIDQPLTDQPPTERIASKPWRCTHRDLRIAIPQPDLEPILKPLLSEALEGVEEAMQQPSTPPKPLIHPNGTNESSGKARGKKGKASDQEWSLVLEFGHSRSEYFDFAIFRARQRPGYSQIMDEDRTLIHRIVFTKTEMRHFWLIWEYVQKWSSTHVYVNGKEIENWKVWPHSQYLR